MVNNSNSNSKTSRNNNLSGRIITDLEVINNSRVTTIQAANNNDSVINRRGRCLEAVEIITTCPSSNSSLITIEVAACVEAIEGALAATWAVEVAWETTTINNTWEVITTNLVVKENDR